MFLLIAVFAAQAQTSIAWKRLDHLKHGINASEWFAQSRDYSPQRLRTYSTLGDIALMRKMGFDHVRISIDPAIFKCPDEWSQCETVQILDQVIAKALAENLAVIIDIHPSDEFKRQLSASDNAVEQFTILWSRIAAYYAKLDPDRVFFEVLNEPEMHDAFRWAGVEQKLVAEIRHAAPANTIIVSGANYSDIDDLVRLPQLADNNLIFNFHYYEPHIFTHQGATWGEAYWNVLRQVPFPSTAEAMGKTIAAQSDDLDRFRLTQYQLNHWDADHIKGEIAFAAAWAKQRNLPLTCNEFGAFRVYSVPQDRDLWLSTVRSALEERGIGWTMWDYQGGFGVVTKQNGQTTEDTGVLQALGLSH